jgi:hypothetical protein
VVPNGESGVAPQIIRECRMRAAILTSIAKDASELEIQLLYVAKDWLTLAIISEQFEPTHLGHRVMSANDPKRTRAPTHCRCKPMHGTSSVVADL